MTESPQPAELNLESIGEVTLATVRLSELSTTVTDKLLLHLKHKIESGKAPRLVLDLSAVKFVDSVALGTLVVMLRRIKQAQGRLALAGMSGHVLNVMKVTGLEKVFQLYPTLGQALAAVKE
jgi:anti-sigma B factor antagonist